MREQRLLAFEGYIIRFAVTFYWMIFWAMNAIDKVVANATYWHGKFRVEKMANYFGSINLTDPLYSIGSLVVAGIVELLAGILLAISLWFLIKKRNFLAHHFYFWGSFVGIIIFSGFAIFDVIFGDRAELLEHSTYWMAIIISWMAYIYFTKLTEKKEL